jgi:hypothetical protein
VALKGDIQRVPGHRITTDAFNMFESVLESFLHRGKARDNDAQLSIEKLFLLVYEMIEFIDIELSLLRDHLYDRKLY